MGGPRQSQSAAIRAGRAAHRPLRGPPNSPRRRPGRNRERTGGGRPCRRHRFLHGKLARLGRAPVRDLYDFASALVHDPDALATAVGLRHPTVLLQDTAITLARRDELRADAATQLEGPQFADVARDPAHPGLAAILAKTIAKMVAERTAEGWRGLARMTDGTSRPINVNPTDPTNDGTPPEGTVEVDAEHATRLIDTWTMTKTVAEQTLKTYHHEELAKPWPSYSVHADERGLSLVYRRDDRTPLSVLGTGLTLDEAVTGERLHRRWASARRRHNPRMARRTTHGVRRTGLRLTADLGNGTSSPTRLHRTLIPEHRDVSCSPCPGPSSSGLIAVRP